MTKGSFVLDEACEAMGEKMNGDPSCGGGCSRCRYKCGAALPSLLWYLDRMRNVIGGRGAESTWLQQQQSTSLTMVGVIYPEICRSSLTSPHPRLWSEIRNHDLFPLIPANVTRAV